MVREVSLARYTWEHLKPLSPNVEVINAERHLPSQFLLAPLRFDQPRRDSGTASGPSSPPPFGFSGFPQGRANAPRAEPWVDSPPPLGNRRMSETPPPRTVRPAAGDPPFSADSVGGFEPLSKTTTVTHTSSSSSGGIRTLSPPATSDKSRSKWKSRFTTAKKETRDHADSSSLSSATLESQKLEEIDLKSLCRRGKHSAGGKFAQHVKVSLSQDSTYSLFWSQSSIQIWDVSTCPPSFKDTISTDGFCILAGVTGTHVAYMTGDRDRKQTVSFPAPRCDDRYLIHLYAPAVDPKYGPDIRTPSRVSRRSHTLVHKHDSLPQRKLRSGRIRQVDCGFIQPI
jgi:hypothetical protein